MKSTNARIDRLQTLFDLALAELRAIGEAAPPRRTRREPEFNALLATIDQCIALFPQGSAEWRGSALELRAMLHIHRPGRSPRSLSPVRIGIRLSAARRALGSKRIDYHRTGRGRTWVLHKSLCQGASI